MPGRIAPAPLPRPRAVMPAPADYIRWPLVAVEELPETHGSNHIHWTITAFQRQNDQGDFVDAVTVVVEAQDEEEAICRAQRLVQRNYYRVSVVNEVCSLDPALKE